MKRFITALAAAVLLCEPTAAIEKPKTCPVCKKKNVLLSKHKCPGPPPQPIVPTPQPIKKKDKSKRVTATTEAGAASTPVRDTVRPTLPPTSRDVSINCNTPTATLYIDGVAFGPANGIYKVGLGSHLLTCRADGYEEHSSNISIGEDTDGLTVRMKSKVLKKLAKYDQGYSATDGFHEGLAKIKRAGANRAPAQRNGRLIVRQLSRYAYIDTEGNTVFTTDFVEDAKAFKEGLAAVKDKNGLWGFIGRDGREVIACQYDSVCSFSEGLAVVAKKGKWGAIDQNGKKVVAFKYRGMGDFVYGHACVQDTYFGVIDKQGNEVVKCRHEAVMNADGGAIGFGFPVGGKGVDAEYWGHVGLFGKMDAMTREYDVIGNNTKPKTTKSKLLKLFHYTDLSKSYITEWPLRVGKSGRFGFVDKDMVEVVPCRYQDVRAFAGGYAAVKQDGKWGFVDANGHETVGCIYDTVADFSEGLATVVKEGRCGVVSPDGREVVSCRYDFIGSFAEGYAPVSNNGHQGFMDRHGNSTLDAEYQVGDATH